MSRDRDAGPAAEEFKAFVGGISWQINDRELKDSAPSRRMVQMQWDSACACIAQPARCPLSANTTPALSAEFREYDATDARVMVDKVTGKSRGFGFVFFGDEKGLRSAIDAAHGTDWDGRRISVTRAIPQSETAPGTPAAVLMGGRDSRGPRCGCAAICLCRASLSASSRSGLC